jgi:hypothetical protein
MGGEACMDMSDGWESLYGHVRQLGQCAGTSQMGGGACRNVSDG